MTEPPEEYDPKSAVVTLVVYGILLMLAVFVTANFILIVLVLPGR